MGDTEDRDTAVAIRTASRFATSHGRGKRAAPVARKRSGSLALTAIAVIAALVGMLWVMLKFAQ